MKLCWIKFLNLNCTINCGCDLVTIVLANFEIVLNVCATIWQKVSRVVRPIRLISLVALLHYKILLMLWTVTALNVVKLGQKSTLEQSMDDKTCWSHVSLYFRYWFDLRLRNFCSFWISIATWKGLVRKPNVFLIIIGNIEMEKQHPLLFYSHNGPRFESPIEPKLLVVRYLKYIQCKALEIISFF